MPTRVVDFVLVASTAIDAARPRRLNVVAVATRDIHPVTRRPGGGENECATLIIEIPWSRGVVSS